MSGRTDKPCVSRESWYVLFSDFVVAPLSRWSLPSFLGDKSAKVSAVASDGRFWISRVLSSMGSMEADPKHVTILADIDDESKALRLGARKLAERLSKVCLSPCRH